MPLPMKVGFDVGGVIIDQLRNDGTDTALHGPRYLETTPVPGAFDAVRDTIKLVRDPARVFIISKCGPEIERKTLRWLEAHRFYQYTGFYRANVHFCRERWDKEPIAKRLGLTHFEDDKREVLGYMSSVQHRILFGPQPAELGAPPTEFEVAHDHFDTLAILARTRS